MHSTVAMIGSESAAFRVMKGALMKSEVEEGNGMKEKKMSDGICYPKKKRTREVMSSRGHGDDHF